MKIFLGNIHCTVLLLLSTMCSQTISSSITDSSEIKSHVNSPKMVPSVKQIVLKKNEQINISCESDKVIHWSYPKKENLHGFHSRVEIEEVPRPNLIVHNATFADTGIYRCYYNLMNENRQISTSTYVFVYDPDNLLTYFDSKYINVFQENTSTLSWCRPTSPNIHLAIMLNGETIVNSTNVSPPFSYDPRYGFTVENIYENMVKGNYTCKATESSHFNYKNVFLTFAPPPLASIKTEKKTYRPDEPVSIECRISTSVPSDVSFSYENITESKKFDSDTVVWINTTAINSGNALCTAGSEDGITFKSLEILVTDLNKDVCDVWRHESNKSIYEGKQMILECGATRYNYDNEIQWYFNNNLLDTNERPKDYLIVNYTTNYSERSMLIITDIKDTDAGNYECREVLESISCGQIDVTVQDIQNLDIHSNDTNAVVRNDSVIIPCRAKYPDVMKLIHNNREIASSVNASSPYSYDPNVGFIIQNPYENLNSSECFCLSERNDELSP